MAEVFEKRLTYVGTDVDLWEIAKICGEWLKYLMKGLINSDMTQRFGKQLNQFGNALDIFGTAYVFEVRHKYVAKDLNILNMPWICGKRIKYLRNGFTILKMI